MRVKRIAMAFVAASLMLFAGCSNEETSNDSLGQIELSESKTEQLSEDVIDKKAYADCASFLVSDNWDYREADENGSIKKLFYWNKTNDNYFYVEEQELLDSYNGDFYDVREYLHWLYDAHVYQDDVIVIEECEDTIISGQDAIKFKYTRTQRRKNRDKTALMYITIYDNKAYYFVFVDRGDSDYKISDYGEEVINSVVLSGGEVSKTEPNIEQHEEETSNFANDGVTLGMSNALDKAKDYLDFTAFSYQGLIDQLLYEKYTQEEAVYAVDNCGADWDEQAAKCAQDYMDYSSFSRQELLDQLLYEGFTQEQAEYGVQSVGY